jgi:cell division protein FtsZ
MKFEDAFGKEIRDVIKPDSKDEQELEEFLKQSAPKVMIVGTGGSGNNTVNRMRDLEIAGAKFVSMNTDAQHLMSIKADKKLLLGKKKTRGLGAGSNPEVGEAAAEESEAEIREAIGNTDLVFITCGMGGGTGTGSASVIARAAKQQGALVVAVVTMPFKSEGAKRKRNADAGLEKLQKEADTTIVIPNDRLLYYVPDLPLNAAFKAADMVLGNAVKGMTELITKPGLVNLDFADLRTILEKAGSAMIGLGESQKNTNERVMEAADKAINSPLLDLDPSTATRALINITGGDDLTLGEAESAVNFISERIAKDSHIIWGATVDSEMEKKGVRVLVVLSGVSEGKPQAKEEENLEVEFV